MKIMDKILTKVSLLAIPLLLVSGIAFASISRDEAVNIVKAEYPNAQILDVDYDVDHGIEIYEVEFRTDTITKGEIEINIATGEIISREIKTHHGHR